MDFEASEKIVNRLNTGYIDLIYLHHSIGDYINLGIV